MAEDTNGGSNLTKLKEKLAGYAEQTNKLKSQREATNADLQAIRENVAAQGIHKEAWDLALKYAGWDEDKREGFDTAYEIVREALDLPVNAQLDLFKESLQRPEDLPDDQIIKGGTKTDDPLPSWDDDDDSIADEEAKAASAAPSYEVDEGVPPPPTEEEEPEPQEEEPAEEEPDQAEAEPEPEPEDKPEPADAAMSNELVGALAREQGAQLSDNPHPKGSPSAKEWAAGWNDTDDQINAVQLEGYEARKDGQAPERCPYPAETTAHIAWVTGYDKRKHEEREEEQDDPGDTEDPWQED